MLKHIIDAYEGTLPKDVYVVFANTGKEMPQTLDFVRDCAEKWDCKINWIELYDVDKDAKGDNTDGWMFKYKLVDYETASRNGEPFEKLIEHYGKLPNSTNRFCTFLLKQRAIVWFERLKVRPECVLSIAAWSSSQGFCVNVPNSFFIIDIIFI